VPRSTGLAATRFKQAAFVVTVSGGGLSSDRAELLDSEWELEKAGFPVSVRRETIAFQTAKNLYMRTGSGWDDYAARRAHARPLAWFAIAGNRSRRRGDRGSRQLGSGSTDLLL
jgi:hypothetical protein